VNRPTLLLIVLFATVSCRRGTEPQRGTVSAVEPAVAGTSAESPERVLAIATNSQATVGDLRIAAGNIWHSEYVPEGGAPRRGPTAGLWFYLRERPSEDRHVRVHPGQALDIAGHRIRVIDVQRGLVRLAVR
jgi:hypothetical protein